MRGKGEGGLFRVPADTTKPLKYWQAVIELPARDGDRRRKFLRSKDKRALIDRLKKAQDDLRIRGDLPTASTTVEQWFTYWLTNVAVKEVRPKTFAGYKSTVKQHIIPGLGAKTKLDKITAQTVRRVHDRITEKHSSTYALNAHRIMARSFEIAVREGRITRNPARLLDAPRREIKTMDAFTVDQAISVLQHIAADPAGAVWATSLLTGARRGEVLGLEVDRVGDYLDLSWQLQRLTFTHGCDGTCGYVRAGACPKRRVAAPADFEHRPINGGLHWTRPKSRAGWRIIPLVDPLRSILERHIAVTGPNPYGLVFTRNGEPIDPDQHTAHWRAILKDTGINKNVVLHGLRHTAVDLMYMADVPEDIIQEIFGHSTLAVTRGYKSPRNQQRMRDAMLSLSALITLAETARTPGTSE